MEAWLGHLLRRPTAVFAATLALLVLAAISLSRLPVTLLPRLDVPSLVIWTAWPDAPPERVERMVTAPLEEAVAGLAGMVEMESRSQLGGSLVRLDFAWSRDLDLAILDVRRQLDRLGGQLPQGVERPVVLPLDPSRKPLWILALSTATANAESLADLRKLAEEVIARRLEQVEGVARVRITGGFTRRLEVLLDSDRLAAYGLQVDDIATALSSANVAVVGGLVRRGPFRYAVELRGDLDGEEAVANVPISAPGKPTVYLHQIAEVRWGLTERRGLARYNGEEVLLLIVEQRPDTNAVATARRLREVLAAQQAELPGVQLRVVSDETTFVEQAINGLVLALAVGGVLAVAVLRLFLRRLRAIWAVAVSVPISLAASFIFFDLFGISLNLISLSGLALGVGMLVDNAIVVVENISRLRDQGVDGFEAGRRGTVEVASAITASTLTTIAVFLPLAFADGLAGQLFRDQSLAVSISLTASLVVALTLVPLMASREREFSPSAGSVVGTKLLHWWEGLVASTLSHGLWCLAATILFLTVAVGITARLPRQSAPRSAEGRLEIGLEFPTDASLELVTERSEALEKTIRSWPEVASVLADLGERDSALLEFEPRPPYRGDLSVTLTDPAATATLLARLRALPLPLDLRIEPRASEDRLESLLTRTAGPADLVIDLIAADRSKALAVEGLAKRALERRPEVARVAAASPQSVAAYRLDFDRDALLQYGVSMSAVAAVVETTTSGREATRLHRVAEAWPVMLRTAGDGSLDTLLAQRVAGAGGSLPIGRFLSATSAQVPAVLWRHRQTPVVRLLADVAPGHDAGAAERAASSTLSAVLPSEVRARLGGAGEAFRSSLRSVSWILLLSVLLVYLILAAQLESITQPLVILATVPLSLAGVAYSLALTGHSWNLMSLTGCVILVGVAVNDAIVKVDRMNQLRREGWPLREAILQASRDRLRPVLMTTITTVLGLLPMALSIGAGSELRAPLAVALIGGLTTSTFFTLVLIPLLYLWLANVESSSRRFI